MSEAERVSPEFVWVWNTSGHNMPGAIFPNVDTAEAWIASVCGGGLLSCYPVGLSPYDYAIEHDYYESKPGENVRSKQLNFAPSYLEHRHYEDGKRVA